jgi:hypothetical protein
MKISVVGQKKRYNFVVVEAVVARGRSDRRVNAHEDSAPSGARPGISVWRVVGELGITG